jgi:hypothetical protein
MLRQAGEHEGRPARIFAQAILKALEHAPAAWQARVRRCAYVACPRPFFWDGTDDGRKRFCSKRHANRSRLQIDAKRKRRPSRGAQLRQARIDRERTAERRAAKAAARRDAPAYVQRLAEREARYGAQYAARIFAAAQGRA